MSRPLGFECMKYLLVCWFYQEKVKYYDIATEKRAEFDRAMAEYIRRKVNTCSEVRYNLFCSANFRVLGNSGIFMSYFGLIFPTGEW